MQLSKHSKIALALSGGGIKAAAFHIGVCLALKEKGFKFAGGSKNEVATKFKDDKLTIKTYVGSSAGAVISAFLASGFSLDAIIDAFERGTDSELKNLKDDAGVINPLKPITYSDLFTINGSNLLKFIPNIMKNPTAITGGIETLIKKGVKINGMFTAKGIERYIRQNVWPDNTFQNLGVQLFIIGTQLNHSRKVIFGAFDETTKNKDIMRANFATVSQAVAASGSLPPVFAPYGIVNNHGKELYFFDGEIRDTLSTHVAADNGADLVIASYSIQPYHFNKQMGSLHEYGIPLIVNQALYQVVQQKIINSINHRKTIEKIYNAIDGFSDQIELPKEHKNKLLEIIRQRSNYDPNVKFIYIHPNPQDYEMFFVDHFSLNPKILSGIVQTGFRSALNSLRKMDI